eukprot:1160616-Pelagomonas_calceolata.AAC.7
MAKRVCCDGLRLGRMERRSASRVSGSPGPCAPCVPLGAAGSGCHVGLPGGAGVASTRMKLQAREHMRTQVVIARLS